MVKVTSISLSCSIFFPELSHFCIYHLSFLSLPSWVKESLSSCVYLSCLWILLSFYHDCGLRLSETFNFCCSTFTFLIETYAAFTRRWTPPTFSTFCLLFVLSPLGDDNKLPLQQSCKPTCAVLSQEAGWLSI